MRPTIAFDLDGVLAEFCYGFTWLAMELGLVEFPNFQREQTTWNFDFDAAAVWREVDRRLSFWSNLEPLATIDDRYAMRCLAGQANIIYVTARRNAHQQTIHWLRQQGFPYGLVFFDEPKGDKLHILKAHRPQLIGVLEDKPSILAALQEGGVPVVARAWQYNHGFEPRVSSVAEFCALMEGKL